ncbi:18454_t:CDS:2 [Gigaspora margarita]|uniref:18454_t:CDS:1 n=1 Tax=Gigaspora margarita TaxID=4874 RepID=A0ABN7W1H1_GIGMA|nr:18454_t:CDS:2 [Gigaspora margarita]
MDASSSFEPLNTSITLLYTSCIVGALLLGVFITSDELEIMLKNAIDLLKTILPPYAFFGCGPQRCCLWALSFHSELYLRGNNTNNYIERSFGILKDIVFARIQAYNCVQRSSIENEFFVPSIQNNDIFYIVNMEIGTCTCPVGMNSALYKHKSAVSSKFHILTFNFLPSLTFSDRIQYTYIALDSFFYALLNAVFTPKNNAELQKNMEKYLIELQLHCIENVKNNYQNSNTQLQAALNKFAECYNVAKSKSIPQLVLFLYDINYHLNPVVNIRIESAKHCKLEGFGHKRILPPIKNKKNLDPQLIPSQKKRKSNKKKYNLGKNITKNQLN